MGLDENAVDLFEVHNAGLVADGFDERTQAQVTGASQQTFAGADDEGQGFRGEGVVTQAGAVELIQNELFDGFGSQPQDPTVILGYNHEWSPGVELQNALIGPTESAAFAGQD
jgi:hypothetical protein